MSFAGKAIKAAIRNKNKADKERQALLNKEGIDSITTIRESAKMEALEAESESSNKDAEK